MKCPQLTITLQGALDGNAAFSGARIARRPFALGVILVSAVRACLIALDDLEIPLYVRPITSMLILDRAREIAAGFQHGVHERSRIAYLPTGRLVRALGNGIWIESARQRRDDDRKARLFLAGEVWGDEAAGIGHHVSYAHRLRELALVKHDRQCIWSLGRRGLSW